MTVRKRDILDENLRLRLTDVDSKIFEQFFLYFFRSGVSLTIKRNGRAVTKRIITAELYAPGSGQDQKGIDLRAEVEGDEIWVFQCKKHKKWTPAQTRKAIGKAEREYQAHHYFLLIACNPHESVQEEMIKHPNWTLWNLDTICAEFRLRVPPSKQKAALFFLTADEIKRFLPFATESLISPEKFFEPFLGADKLFHHNLQMIGRVKELAAMRGFLTSPKKVQIISAKGGEGKSRLLWEFCRSLASNNDGLELLCLNPYRNDQDFAFAFVNDLPKLVILADDAHRANQIPLPLLSLVRQHPTAKLILASRPQGIEMLHHDLDQAGLAECLARDINLSPLTASEMIALSREALGDTFAAHAKSLVASTQESPFLTVIASTLLRQGHLKFNNLAQNEDFRRRVFGEFEGKNLESIPAAEKKLTAILLRLLAMLTPAVIDSRFHATATRCLGCAVHELDSTLQYLRQIGLAAGGDDGLRIVPDLFADFLIYETCYGVKTNKPGFVHQVIDEFSYCNPTLLRNLSEATWIARACHVDENKLLEPVIQRERERFAAGDEFVQSEIIRHWSSISGYLPGESLDFARYALRILTSGRFSNHKPAACSLVGLHHNYALDNIPAMLKPVATYHDRHRHAALDLLWKVGLSQSWTASRSKQDHAWAVIAEIVKFDPTKPLTVTLDNLAWLANHIKDHQVLCIIEETSSVLFVLIDSCFARSVESTEWQGRTLNWHRQNVSIEKTQVIRNEALAIVDWVIENGSWRAALQTISVLAEATRRVSPFDTVQDKETNLREQWLPERLHALALYGKLIQKHTVIAVRYGVRQVLKQYLASDDDQKFADACLKLLGEIKEDLEMRVAVAISNHERFEFPDPNPNVSRQERHDYFRTLWQEKVRETAFELVRVYTTPNAILSFTDSIASQLISAGYSLIPNGLFEAVAQIAPAFAADLARHIVDEKIDSPITRGWTALIAKNPGLDEPEKTALFRQTIRNGVSGVRLGILREFSRRVCQDQALSKDEKDLLLELAAQATDAEAIPLLKLVSWSSDTHLPWIFQILEVMKLGMITKSKLNEILEALMPPQQRAVHPPRSTVKHVLCQFVAVNDLDFLESQRAWMDLIDLYPREVYDLFLARISYAASVDPIRPYMPIPAFAYPGRLRITNLVKETDFSAICDVLWQRVSQSNDPQWWSWSSLFQAVVFEKTECWHDRMLSAIKTVTSESALRSLCELMRFEGSLIVFHYPAISRACLQKAKEYGDAVFKEIRGLLRSISGPISPVYTNGALNKKDDYVEAAAVKAAEIHASDELLGPFYRWIVEVEEKERLFFKKDQEAFEHARD